MQFQFDDRKPSSTFGFKALQATKISTKTAFWTCSIGSLKLRPHFLTEDLCSLVTKR